jgi:hypothetical protein
MNARRRNSLDEKVAGEKSPAKAAAAIKPA